MCVKVDDFEDKATLTLQIVGEQNAQKEDVRLSKILCKTELWKINLVRFNRLKSILDTRGVTIHQCIEA